MSNAQIANKIKQTCKEKNITISQLLEKCEIRKSLIYDLEKRDYTPSIAIINVIADYLGVSVDYLLGRADEPTEIKQNNVVNVNNSGDNNTNNVNIGKASTEDISEITEMIKNLSLIERSKVILFIEEMKTKNK